MTNSFFKKIKEGLTKTRDALVGQITEIFTGNKVLDDDTCDELEAILISSDMGVTAATAIVDALRKRSRSEHISDEMIKEVLADEILKVLGSEKAELVKAPSKPTVIMAVGVNGTGKTTTIAKLASSLTAKGNKVVLGAADTFRAAAAEQLETWGDRINCDVIKHGEGSDPAAVAFDSYKAAVARDADYLIIDTAGRLHNKSNLMEELKKIKRVVSKESPDAPHEVLLVLDATTGQNAIVQARAFNEAVDITGLVLTKLDGTAKGGVALAVASQFELPITFIGLGEKMEDLRPFDPHDFARALLGREEA